MLNELERQNESDVVAKARESLEETFQREIARQNSAMLKADRGASMDAQVLTVIRRLMETSNKSSIAIKDITDLFTRVYSKDYDRQVTSRWLGYLVRRKLNLFTQKSHGVFVIPVSERPKLEVKVKEGDPKLSL